MAVTTYKLDWQTKNVRFYAEDMTFLESAIPDGATSVTFNSATKRIDFHGCPNPWVKVGTTTIDGTIMQVASSLLLGRALATLEDADHTIDIMVRDTHPWFVGGRHLMAKGSHVNLHTGTALIRCDIVRRQSEIEAENTAAIASKACKQFAAICAAGTKPTCPECGPHGNGGRVLGLEEWYPCTTCGEVVESSTPSDEVEWLSGEPEGGYHQVSWNVPREVLFGEAPSGFAVPGQAEVDNYLRWCSADIKVTV